MDRPPNGLSTRGLPRNHTPLERPPHPCGMIFHSKPHGRLLLRRLSAMPPPMTKAMVSPHANPFDQRAHHLEQVSKAIGKRRKLLPRNDHRNKRSPTLNERRKRLSAPIPDNVPTAPTDGHPMPRKSRRIPPDPVFRRGRDKSESRHSIADTLPEHNSGIAWEPSPHCRIAGMKTP